jgi:hypothetical protein
MAMVGGDMRSRVSALLGEILRYHKDGYQGLRLMPLEVEEEQEVAKFLVGPRRYFSTCDGSFVSEDWRSKCVEVTISATSSGDDKRVIWNAFRRQFDRGELRDREDSSLPLPETFVGWLNLSKLKDEQYAFWFTCLDRRASWYSAAIPYREPQEAESVATSSFSILYLDDKFDQEVAPATNLDAPPPGTSYSTPSAKRSSLEPTVAEYRGAQSPNLLWNTRHGPTYDQRVDQRWDESN